MSDEKGRLPGASLHRVLERVLTRRILDGVVIPALADLQHEDALVRQATVWRRAWVRIRGYLGIWNALALCLATWPARSLRENWLESGAAGPTLVRALAPRAGILVLGFTLLLVGRPGDPGLLLSRLPSVLTVTVPLAFFLGLVLTLSRLGARASTSAGSRWLSVVLGLSMASSMLTFGLYGWATPQANQSFRERAFRLTGTQGEPMPKGLRELTLAELQTQIRAGHEGTGSTTALHVEWHKRWALPAACLIFGPLAIGLNGLWKRPRPAMPLGLAFAATLLLYVALRFGEQAALQGRLGPLPAIWAGDALLAFAALCLIARLPPLRAASACDSHTSSFS